MMKLDLFRIVYLVTSFTISIVVGWLSSLENYGNIFYNTLLVFSLCLIPFSFIIGLISYYKRTNDEKHLGSVLYTIAFTGFAFWFIGSQMNFYIDPINLIFGFCIGLFPMATIKGLMVLIRPEIKPDQKYDELIQSNVILKDDLNKLSKILHDRNLLDEDDLK